MEWLVTLLAGGVLAVLLDWALRATGRRLSRPMVRSVSRLRRRRSVIFGSPEPRASSVMPEYFKEIGPATLDLAVYELSLRPDIPIMDLLYFEYLRRRLASGTLHRLFVVPWNGRGDVNKIAQNESLLSTRLEKIFGDAWSDVTLVGAEDLDRFAPHLLSERFMDSLEDLGSSTFLKESSRMLGFRFRSYHDINSGHPESLQARSLVEHSVRGWLIFRYLTEGGHVQVPEGATTLRVGSLIWERELSKLLLLRNLEDGERSPDIGFMIGKSVTFRTGLGRRPLPAYEGAIELFHDPKLLTELCVEKSGAELAVSLDVVMEVLSELPKRVRIRNTPGVVAIPANAGSNRHTLSLVVQLQHLRDAYGFN